jgi:hypothetical protein
MPRLKKWSAAVGLGLLALTFISGPAVAAGCPAFTAAMVDSAWLGIDFSQTDPIVEFTVVDDEFEPRVLCAITNDEGNEFAVRVQFEDAVTGFAEIDAKRRSHINNGLGGVTQLLRTKVFDLTSTELHMCRAEVLASFVWNQYCEPLLSSP